ncbi:hypothetical protein NQ317_018106 [Molorchus minor]|uniref:Transposase n=1 Tax=Molorchus minor TaxID=1323400 RepID=A0ABQ9JBP5_9CUCU|nr:hypothetical protein NQ317_018106 [Molorchus minor]
MPTFMTIDARANPEQIPKADPLSRPTNRIMNVTTQFINCSEYFKIGRKNNSSQFRQTIHLKNNFFILPIPQDRIDNLDLPNLIFLSSFVMQLRQELIGKLGKENVEGKDLNTPESLPRHSNLMEFLDELPLNERRNIYFQQDGAPPHNSRIVSELLTGNFGDNWIGTNGPIRWPPRSPDLTPLDFFFLAHIQDNLYKKANQNMDELRTNFIECVDSFSNIHIYNAARGVSRRCELCVVNNGRQFENRMKAYKPKFLHTLEVGDRERRIEFCLWLQDMYLNNTRMWCKENPHWVIQCKRQYSVKVNVWCRNLNANGFLRFLENEFTDEIDALPLNDRLNLHVQLDGAPIDNSVTVRNWLNRNFPNRWIGRNSPLIYWPLQSPDLTLLDFFFCGELLRIKFMSQGLKREKNFASSLKMPAIT